MHTPRLLLREYRWEDLAEHNKLITDPDVMYYIQDVFSRSFAESLDNLAVAAASKYEDPAEREFVFLVIADPKTEEYMGGIGYTVLERIKHEPLNKCAVVLDGQVEMDLEGAQ